MYEEFFKFSSPPFRLNPDPKFFFGSRSHNKAMAYLHYGLRQGEGFIVITGEIGAGKSMLISHLMDQLDRSNVVAAHLLTTNLEPSALLSHILSAFRIEPSGGGESAAIEAFEDFLFDQMNRGRRVLLIVDEAQNLPAKTIEELRMLSNMDYDGTPLFQVFLVGQPEFKSLLSKPEMEQFRQRVIASYHLEPLGEEESTEYIKHRLSLVGWSGDPSISGEAFHAIFKATGGVPRKINKLCNRIFLYCGLEKRHAIDLEVADTVIADLRSETVGSVEVRSDEAPKAAPEANGGKDADSAKPSDAAREIRTPSRRSRHAIASKEARPKEIEDAAAAPVVIPFEQARKGSAKEAPGGEVRNEAAAPAAMAHDQRVMGAALDGVRKVAGATPQGKVSEGAMGGNEPSAEAEGNANSEQMSVLDRLRAQRRSESSGAKPFAADNETAAKLKDVARAIERAAAGAPVAAADDEGDEGALLPPINAPELSADPSGWRMALARSINETRDELKSAHQNVSLLRRRLAEIDRQKSDRRRQAAERLTAAESLLAEMRKSWR